MDKNTVLFFSRDGSTRIAAGYLAEKLGAGLVELKEEKPHRSFLRYGFLASAKKHSKLAGDPWAEVRDCTTLIIGSPIWAGNGNPVVNGFLDKADFKGKKVYLFTVQADPGKKRSDEVLEYFTQRVNQAGGTVAGTRALTGTSPGKTADAESLKNQLGTWPASSDL